MAGRLSHRDEINGLVAAWVRTMTQERVLAECDRHQVPCGPIYSIKDIFEDPQYRARENVVEVASRAGPISIPNALPRMSLTPSKFKHAGVAIGHHTEEILGALAGVDAQTLARLRDAKIV
jgi:crotonobetainyl-CoA:carnitine CoA-transferase CaiB-like acyl-CoA transferase